MKTIWKFELKLHRINSIQMPGNAEILCVQIDQKFGIPYIWAIVDPLEPPSYRIFELVGTRGQIKSEKRKYIGTSQHNNGELIVHVFEVS